MAGASAGRAHGARSTHVRKLLLSVAARQAVRGVRRWKDERQRFKRQCEEVEKPTRERVTQVTAKRICELHD